MKSGLVILLYFISFSASGQRRMGYDEIDRYVCCIEASDVRSLAQQLTFSYQTDLEKVRAIFSWIAQHISYRTGLVNNYKFTRLMADTATGADWKTGDEMTADKVFENRIAVCDGYSKLFKTLCTYSGIKCEVITGFARGDSRRISKRFNSNHTWNAVYIDSQWKLLDVTWGSGFLTYSDQYIQSIDETYFLAEPSEFIHDHYPEDLKWTLLDHSPALYEFQHNPFKFKTFVKYGINKYAPGDGIIKASVGDTLHFELELSDFKKSHQVAPDPFFDITDSISFRTSGILKPDKINGNKIEYVYVIEGNKLEWINILYNDDPVLRYRLNVRDR